MLSICARKGGKRCLTGLTTTFVGREHLTKRILSRAASIKIREKWRIKWQEIIPKIKVISRRISRAEIIVYITVLILITFDTE